MSSGAGQLVLLLPAVKHTLYYLIQVQEIYIHVVYAHRIKSLWHFLQHVPLLKLTNPSTFAGVVKSSPSCLLIAFIQIIRNFYHIVRWGALYHWFGTKITW